MGCKSAVCRHNIFDLKAAAEPRTRAVLQAFFSLGPPALKPLSGLAKLLARVFTLLTLHERHGFSPAHS